ncbi:NAD-dependent epimerase/dehydratase family protein, partial [Patescibacteria group bacterium]|nr:NAD-dependent epimerase/dehydratase family protein [Patescibacteria group bacterium]
MTEQELSQCTILVTGGNGFLGKHVVTRLIECGVPPAHIRTPTSHELDLRDREQVRGALRDVDVVIHLAAHVGGISYNRAHPATIFYDNLLMGTHVIHEAYAVGVQKLTIVGTVCSYPKHT